MATRRITRRSRARGGGRKVLRVVLTPEEGRVVLDACRRLQHTTPGYLESAQGRLRLIDSVIRKLS